MLWAAAGGVAIVAAGNAASQVSRPAMVSALAVFSANDGDALARRFTVAFFRAKGKISDPRDWLNATKRVLARNPLEADVVRVAALASFAAGEDLRTTRSLMMMSERVSARDLQTQLWLLQDAVSRDNVGETLQHYDRALSVHPKTKALLYPVLSRAISDGNIRVALAPYIRAGRPWAYEYVGYAIDNAAETADVADLMTRAGGSRAVPKNRPLETMMLNTLVVNGRFDAARRYAWGMMRPSEASAVLSDFRFSAATMDSDLRPFTWSTTEDLSIRVTFTPAEGLDVTAGSGISAVAADRVMMLPPGKWRFAQKVDLPTLSPMMEATWSAICMARDGYRSIWTQSIPQQPGQQSYQAVLDIPRECQATRFRLTVRGADTQEDSMITIHNVDLTRV